ncbi:MAG: 4'-phosphopantetheinyl transferase superfamily protein [Anaerolineae bacterium]|nr:4'-phosphopantetheinyl transferase superfamily protein [Anaerolineae bacterium]
MNDVLWLMQTAAAHPDLTQGRAPAGLLTPAEAACFAALKTPKRRHDWLLGRWTAKRLLQGQVPGNPEILNNADGVPLVTGCPALSLSISHCDDRAVCAAAWQHTVGVDVERIAPRQPVFVQDYFTPLEVAQVDQAAPAQRDTLVTLIWSAKETALKVLHRGLSLDTRTVQVTLPAAPPAAAGWSPLHLDCGPQGSFPGWWRMEAGYVFTLAVNAR